MFTMRTPCPDTLTCPNVQVAKVYLSIFSDDMGKALAMANLKKLEGYVRYNVGQQMRLRLVPEIRFIEASGGAE